MMKASIRVLEDAPYMLSTVEDAEKVEVEEMCKVIQTFRENPHYLQVIAEIGGYLVGAIEFRNGEKQKISHQGSFGMTVMPEYRNSGIGRILLDALIQWAQENPYIEKVCLEVMEDNHGAIHLYESFGFEEEGRKRKAVKLNRGYQDLILMALFV
ncbi:GNAT family N-acetyltransferase [Pontibacillus salicampi]|uniref:GNAT family N-acetyltransferase n=1 Tax=Pontibacillus salicampi TaxID=1449801 RepID=A0ABV6LQQ0_9BACI